MKSVSGIESKIQALSTELQQGLREVQDKKLPAAKASELIAATLSRIDKLGKTGAEKQGLIAQVLATAFLQEIVAARGGDTKALAAKVGDGLAAAVLAAGTVDGDLVARLKAETVRFQAHGSRLAARRVDLPNLLRDLEAGATGQALKELIRAKHGDDAFVQVGHTNLAFGPRGFRNIKTDVGGSFPSLSARLSLGFSDDAIAGLGSQFEATAAKMAGANDVRILYDGALGRLWSAVTSVVSTRVMTEP
ncbi:MAG: hypothetical protein HY903_14605 [Deltaproteobacteria bacterium]|nr:hypothetical protein [Deltaproteobacteria bacterium]